MTTPYQQNAKTPAGPIASTPAGATWGGFRGLLKRYAGAAAGYSLRKIGSGPVVRLRRASDNAEKDFAAGEVVAGTAGAELVTNGDFATDSDWTKSANWTITGGQAVSDGTVNFGAVSQNGIISGEAGVYYKITFTIVACSDFAGAGTLINSNIVQGFSGSWQITSAGTYSAIFKTTGSNTNFRFYTGAGVTMTLDDVSCVPYTPSAAELWALDGKARQARQATESAYATTWYDQSGSGNDATQATAAAQPLLIRAGVTNTVNGKAALSFDGVDDRLIMPASIEAAGSFCISAVSRSAQTATVTRLLDASPENEFFRDQASLSEVEQWVGGAGGPFKTTIVGRNCLVQNLLTYERTSSTDGFAYSNGTSPTAQTYGSGTMSVDSIGVYDAITQNFVGDVQEIIIYDSDQSANRTGIETNINDHYGIY